MGSEFTLLKWLKNNALGTYLLTRRHTAVGEDEVGNRYFRIPAADWRRERRWVVYAGEGEIEASSIPPSWSAWLHHSFEKSPAEVPPPSMRWEKAYEPNLSGTAQAYMPPGHASRGGKRDRATGDYEAWRP